MANLESRLVTKPPIQEIKFSRKEFLKLDLASLEILRKDNNSVFSVHGLEDGSEGFIPMMNFHLEEGADLNFIRKTLRLMGEGGVILSSGRYFHYYSNRVLNKDDWLNFVGKIMLPTVIVTQGYVGYCLIRGATLRLSTNNIKNKVPEVIELLT